MIFFNMYWLSSDKAFPSTESRLNQYSLSHLKENITILVLWFLVYQTQVIKCSVYVLRSTLNTLTYIGFMFQINHINYFHLSQTLRSIFITPFMEYKVYFCLALIKFFVLIWSHYLTVPSSEYICNLLYINCDVIEYWRKEMNFKHIFVPLCLEGPQVI